MEDKERKGLWHAFTVLAAAYGIVQMIAGLMMWEGKRLEQENKGKKTKKYLNFMNGSVRKLKGEAVEDIELISVIGGTELDLTGAQLADETRIKVCAVMSGVVIKVPPMVEVQEDSRTIMSGVANMVPRYNRAGIPVIRLDAECVMSGVNVKVIVEE